jgi:hypothetical protein
VNRIPRAFEPNALGLAGLRPAVDWFAQGKGVASRKWDGVPVLLHPTEEGGWMAFRGIRFLLGLPEPPRFLRHGIDGAMVSGWLPVGEDDEDVVLALGRLYHAGLPIYPGTYELCGPGIKDNPEGFELPTLLRHGGLAYIRTPRSLDDLVMFMIEHPAEGIVWEYDGALCQLTRKDVGLEWPEP